MGAQELLDCSLRPHSHFTQSYSVTMGCGGSKTTAKSPAPFDATLVKNEDTKDKIDVSTLAGMTQWLKAASPEEVQAALTTLPAEVQSKLQIALDSPVAESNKDEKAEGKAEDKAEDKQQDKVEDKAEGNAEDKVQDKVEDKVEDKVGDKVDVVDLDVPATKPCC